MVNELHETNPNIISLALKPLTGRVGYLQFFQECKAAIAGLVEVLVIAKSSTNLYELIETDGVFKMKRVIALCCVVFLGACSDPKQSLVPSDPTKWDTELKPIIEKLSDEEKKLLGAYLIRTKLGEAFGGEAMLPGTTVADAIQTQKDWQAATEKREAEEKALKEQKAAEEKALQEKITAERAAIKQRIDSAITVTVLNTYLQKVKYNENQIIEIGIENKGTKDITGIKGTVHFIDIFDKDVGQISFGYDDGLKAGATTTWTGSRDYNQFLDAHKAIAQLEKGKYTSRFEPEMIVFSDGEKLSMPE